MSGSPASATANDSMANAVISDAQFQNAFVLMDHRGLGTLELDTVFDFVDTLDRPPSHDLVKKVYNDFDEDGSGDIDREEFYGLCQALQRLTRVSVANMIAMYTKHQYNRLFDLAYVGETAGRGTTTSIDDDDASGGEGERISVKDLQVFLDSTSELLQISNGVIQNALREAPSDSVSRADFAPLIARCIKGKSISQVVLAFQKAQQARIESRQRAYQMFGGQGGRSFIGRQRGIGSGGATTLTAAEEATSASPSSVPPPRRGRSATSTKKATTTTPDRSSAAALLARSRSGGGGGTQNQQQSLSHRSDSSGSKPPTAAVTTGTTSKHSATTTTTHRRPSGKWQLQRNEDSTSKVFEEAFALIDSRGGGVLSLDNVHEFCSALPDPPLQSVTRKLFNQFDVDGSGDIDGEEFYDFCIALENAVGMNVRDMLSHFTAAMYRRLFDMVVVGGAGDAAGAGGATSSSAAAEGGGAVVSKDELKMFLEAISPLLNSDLSPDDVYAMVREYPVEQFNLASFQEVVKQLTAGKSIAQVVSAFEEAHRRRKAAKHYAKTRLEGGSSTPSSSTKGGAGSSSSSKPRATLCFGCLEKQDQLRTLQEKVDQLEAALKEATSTTTGARGGGGSATGAAAAGSSFATVMKSSQQAATAGGGGEGREKQQLFGNVWESLHTLDRVVTSATRIQHYPEFAKAALHHVGAQRFLHLGDFFLDSVRQGGQSVDVDLSAKFINDNVSDHEEHCGQLRAVVDVSMVEVREFHVQANRLIDTLAGAAPSSDESGDGSTKASPTTTTTVAAVEDLLGHLELLRERCQSMRSDAEWLVDDLVERRSACTERMLAVAPHTDRSIQLASTLVDMEHATQRLLDMVVVMNLHGSAQLSDAEVLAHRLLGSSRAERDGLALPSPLSAADAEKARESMNAIADGLSPNRWNDLFTDVSATMKSLARTASLTHTRRREKAMMTLPVMDLTPLDELKARAVRMEQQRQEQEHQARIQQTFGAAAASGTQAADGTVHMTSARPRTRSLAGAGAQRPRDGVAHVDRLVERYVTKSAMGVDGRGGEGGGLDGSGRQKNAVAPPPLPPNFHRVGDGTTNTFQFGTKKIEITPLAKNAVVKVGGGYLTFEEFCQKNAAQETRRVWAAEQMAAQREAQAAAAAAASSGGSSSIRIGGSSSLAPPTALVASTETASFGASTPRGTTTAPAAAAMATQQRGGGSRSGWTTSSTPRSSTPTHAIVRKARGFVVV